MLLLAATAASLAAAAPGAAAPAATRVTVRDFAFSPAVARVRPGGTVTWRFRDAPIRHDVTSRGTRRFPRVRARSRGTATRTFARAGTFRYVCTLHPGMAARVVVRR